METGSVEDLFEIIPRIGVIRDARFKQPLLSLLSHREAKRREFAAYAMGAMGDRDFLEPLKRAFHQTRRAPESQAGDLQIAIIAAIGAIGDDAAVDFFLPILRRQPPGKSSPRMHRMVVDSLGMIAQQGGQNSAAALFELTSHGSPELRALALYELSVAYWHRPNEIPDEMLHRIFELTRDRSATVAEAALAALQSLADVGCRRAEDLFARNP